jgi:hypothetical protein
VIQETLNFVITHDFWVLLVIEKDELTNPVKIGLLGSVAVLLRSDLCADRLQKRRNSCGLICTALLTFHRIKSSKSPLRWRGNDLKNRGYSGCEAVLDWVMVLRFNKKAN